MGKQGNQTASSSQPQRSDGQPLFNWLAALDSCADQLKPARSWLAYPFFMRVRYPSLWPATSAEDPNPRMLAVMREMFIGELTKQEARIASHKKGTAILRGLTADQRRQLAALVIDCVADFENHKGNAEYGKKLTKLTKEATRRQRMLDKGVAKVRTSLESLRDYAAKLDPLLGATHKTFADRTLTELSRLSHYESPASLRHDRELAKTFPDIGFNPFPGDPTTASMVQVYWFFRHECRLSGNESEMRTAWIREVCFVAWNKPVRVIQLHPTPESESRGSTAVAQAVRRFRPKS